jgi:hypothetical protein
MISRYLKSKDFYGGLLMLMLGLIASVTGWGYDVGQLSQMGPGFFPVAVGGLLSAIGMLIMIFGTSGASVEAHGSHGVPSLRACVCIVAGLVAFILAAKYAGLLVATFAIVFISGLGDRENKVKDLILLASALCVIAVVVFWWALKMQIPLVKFWG